MVFSEPTNPEAAVIADAMICTGRVGDSLYARLLAATDRLYAPLPVTRAFAFDALGTLVHIGRKLLPFKRVIRQARRQAEALPSPMVQPVSLADYAAALGLPHPVAKLAMLDEELVTIALPDTLDALRRGREQDMRIAVASNLALPYAASLSGLLGDLIYVWHSSLSMQVRSSLTGAIYAGLIAQLDCGASEPLMVGVTGAIISSGLWRPDCMRSGPIVRVALLCSPVFVVRELGDVCPDQRRTAQMTELEVVRTSIEANFDDLHVQRWALQAEGLRQATNTPDAEKTAAMRALDDQHDIRDQPETSRAALMWNAIVAIAARISPASQPIAKLEQADSVL